jgi:hypothetical protein
VRDASHDEERQHDWNRPKPHELFFSTPTRESTYSSAASWRVPR